MSRSTEATGEGAEAGAETSHTLDATQASTEELPSSVEELQHLVSSLRASVAMLQSRISELEAALESSRRSAKRQAAPFSKRAPKDSPATPGRKRGEAHGRHGHRMAPAQLDRTLHAALPEACPDCGGELAEDDPARQYQSELPVARPQVTCFVVHRGRCRACGKRVQGRHAEQSSDALGAASCQLGPRAVAAAVYMHYSMGISFGRCAETMKVLFGIDVTRGALAQAAGRTGAALAPTCAAIKTTLASTASVTMDETGWRIGGHGAWLWVAASKGVTVYSIASGRGYAQATTCLPGSYSGVLVRDGWSAYRRYEQAEQQSCLAHLLRRAKEMKTDNPPEHRETPIKVSDILHRALAARAVDEPKRTEVVAELSKLVVSLSTEDQAYDPNRRLVAHLAGEHARGALFTFLTHEGVDATNWRAETAIRPAVVNRKCWGGNRTARGAANQGRIMTFLRTATQQGADAIELLVGLACSPTPCVVRGLYLGTPPAGP